MRRAERDDHAGMLRQSIEHEVAIGRERVQARLRRNGLAGARKAAAHEAFDPAEAVRIGEEVAGARSRLVAADVLADLRPRAPIAGKTVEGWLIQPDPDREAPRRERRRVGGLEPGDLFPRDG